MFDAAGSGLVIENAIATAKIINATRSMGSVPTSLGAFGNSQLAKDVASGKFEPGTEL